MKAAFHTLGCKVNFYETEALKELFSARDFEIVSENEFADVYVINTCTVTSLADRKSRQYIRRMKKVNPKALVAVTGCYAQTSPDEVAAIEAVDIVMGTKEKAKLIDYVEEALKSRSADAVSAECKNVAGEPIVDVRPYEELCGYDEMGTITSMESRTRAFVKVQEGCNRFCAYCLIPFARGSVRSRAPFDVLCEVKTLLQNGFKEIILTGINTALYGTEADFKEKYAEDEVLKEAGDAQGIEILIKAINALPGEFRIRLSSLEPTVINCDYVKGLFKYERLCHHLHLSAQSGSDHVLTAMNRRYDRKEYLEIAAALKEFDKCYGISTDIIAGFPGESEEDFADSIRLTEEISFCKVHAFKYSKRPRTAAAEMKNHIAPQVKNRRVSELIEAGEKSSKAFFTENLGTSRVALIEEYLPEIGMYTGYLDNYIRAYVPASHPDAATGETSASAPQSGESLLNRLVRVRIEELYKDGVRGSLAED